MLIHRRIINTLIYQLLNTAIQQNVTIIKRCKAANPGASIFKGYNVQEDA